MNIIRRKERNVKRKKEKESIFIIMDRNNRKKSIKPGSNYEGIHLQRREFVDYSNLDLFD